MKNKADRLRGRQLMFRGSSLRRKTLAGWYSGKITRVTRGKRGGISRIVVTRCDGSRVRLFPEEWTDTPQVTPDGRKMPRSIGIRHYGVTRSVDELDALLGAKEEAA